jgi:hypothetical protein
MAAKKARVHSMLGVGIDPYSFHTGEVEHDPAVTHRVTRHAVAAAPDRHHQVVFPSKGDAAGHIGLARAPDYGLRPTIDHAVEDRSERVVFGVRRSNQRSAQLRCQPIEDAGRHAVRRFMVLGRLLDGPRLGRHRSLRS